MSALCFVTDSVLWLVGWSAACECGNFLIILTYFLRTANVLDNRDQHELLCITFAVVLKVAS